MKRLYSWLLFLCLAVSLFATQMIIHKTDGTEIQVNVNEIESITFGEAVESNMVFVQGTADVIFEPGGYGYFNPGGSGGGNYNVFLSDFYIRKYEVTQSEYEAVMGNWDSDPHGWDKECGIGDDYPVYYVSWFNAIEYCNRLSILEGLTPAYSYGDYGTDPDNWPDGWDSGNTNHDHVYCDWNANGYMLPTEMQREYAARGGVPAQQAGTFDTTYAGSNNIDEVAWYDDNSGSTTHHVGTKLPNELGLYDMSGNTWEWAWDRGYSYPSGSHTDPTGPSNGTFRLFRGGSWNFNDYYCAVSFRFNGYPTVTSAHIGFRYVRRSN